MTCCGKVRHGAVGLVKAVLGVDRPAENVIELRRGICLGCELRRLPIKRIDLGGYCVRCKCWLAAKTAIKSEACPIGKWGQT